MRRTAGHEFSKAIGACNDSRPVEGGQLAHEDADRPAVEDDLVERDEHGVVVLAEAHQEAAHERAVRQGERPERLGEREAVDFSAVQVPRERLANAPAGRWFHTTVWTGAEMIVWGGAPLTSTGGRYCACPNGTTAYRDADGDGFGDPGVSLPSCDGSIPAGYVANSADCNDSDPNVHRDAAEICNGIDDNCNGQIDEDAVGEDSDGDLVRNLCDNFRVSNPGNLNVLSRGTGVTLSRLVPLVDASTLIRGVNTP